MQIYNHKQGYGIVTILIHWLMAIIIIGLFILGKIMIDLDYYDSNYHVFPWWHKSFGIIIFIMFIIRVLWKWFNPKVIAVQTLKPIEIKATAIMHVLLYLLIIICCISGTMISTAQGAGVSVFGWFEVPALIQQGQIQADLAGEIHEMATLLIIILASLHMLMALKHHFIQKDDTLKRMLFINRNKS